jgi:hypothetical protein
MCALTTLRIQHPVKTRRRTQMTRLLFLTRRDAGQALNVAMTIPALAGPPPAGMQSR